MDCTLLDRYLLEGRPPKDELIRMLLSKRSTLPAASGFYAGIELLGAKTPDLTLIALRLVLAGKKADDASVVRLRDIVGRARGEGADAASLRAAYFEAL